MEYILGKAGVNNCPDTYETITTVSECKTAAIALNNTVSETNDDNDNRVCFMWGGGDGTFRLSHSHGSMAEFVCKRPGKTIVLIFHIYEGVFDKNRII